jgi:4-carboxymuconolactone decarboxylase
MRMKRFSHRIGLLVLIGIGLTSSHSLHAQSKQSPAESASFPKDIYPDTGNRLPAIKREDLDDTGKKLFDAKGPSDTYGPGSIRLYSLSVEQYAETTNDFLRHKAGIDPRIVELVILITAREADCAYVWNAHEPQGLKAGLPKETIDVVRYRRPLVGVEEKDGTVIQLGREVLEKHHVESATAAHALKLFGKQGLVNLVSLMGDYAATEILLNTFDQHVRPTEKPLLTIP